MVNSQVKHKEQKQGHGYSEQCAAQTPLQSRHHHWSVCMNGTQTMFTQGRAQQGHVSQGSYKPMTLLSGLVCVTAKMADLRPASNKRAS